VATIDLRFSVIGICAALIAGCGGGADTTGGGGGGGGGGNGGGGNNSTTVTVTFGGPAVPVLVAAKIGTGAFVAQTLNGATLSLSIPSGTSDYVLVAVCPGQFTGLSSGQSEFVWEASTADGTSTSVDCPYASSQTGTGTLTGSLDASAISGVQSFQVISQNAGTLTSNGQGGGPAIVFGLPAPVGSDRVLVLADGTEGLIAAKNFDNQTVPGALNAGNTVVFGAADEITPESVTYNNVPSGFSTPEPYADFEMHGSGVTVGLPFGSTTQYPALPASAIENGDAYLLGADAAIENGAVYSEVYAQTTSPGGPVSLTFPAPWSYAGPTPAALPSFTIGYTGFSGQSNVIQEAFLQYDTGATAFDLIFVEATASYQNGSTTLAVPDLSSVPGALAPPTSGVEVQWSIGTWQQSYGLGTIAPLNSTESGVENFGSYTVP
jgi:hypothetical protein